MWKLLLTRQDYGHYLGKSKEMKMSLQARLNVLRESTRSNSNLAYPLQNRYSEETHIVMKFMRGTQMQMRVMQI